MNRRTLNLAALSALAIAQLAVPLFMIARREAVLRHGVAYRFRTAPVDPADAFRGRYVALRTEENRVQVPPQADYRSGQRVYALLETAHDGFTRIAGLSAERPATPDFIKTRVEYHANWGPTNYVYLRLPFDRYYMNEKLAPQAEQAYWRHSSRTNRNTHIVVRVKNGFAVLERLYIGDLPVEEFLRQELAPDGPNAPNP